MLVVGAILESGQRMISPELRAVALSQERHLQTYHRALNCTSWSRLGVNRILLGLLVATVAPADLLVVVIDETIERP